MAQKIQQIKKHISKGNLQLAKFDQNNQPVKMQISQLQNKTLQLKQQQQVHKMIKDLSWEQKFQWVNTRRLKGNHLFKTQKVQQALNTYLQSLIGLQLKNEDQLKNVQIKFDLLFPILMNVAACFYKLKQYQQGIQICDQVLNDPQGKQFYQASFKKAYFLFELGNIDKAKEILLELNTKINQNQNQKKVSRNDIKELLSKILAKTKQQKNMYRKIFYQQEDDLQSSSQSQIKQEILQYHQNFIKKALSWLKQALQSCCKVRTKSSVYIEQEQKSKLLKNKRK